MPGSPSSKGRTASLRSSIISVDKDGPQVERLKRASIKQRKEQELTAAVQAVALRRTLAVSPEELEPTRSEVESALEEYTAGLRDKGPPQLRKPSSQRNGLSKSATSAAKSSKRANRKGEETASSRPASFRLPNPNSEVSPGLTATEEYVSRTVAGEPFGPSTPMRKLGSGNNRQSARISNLVELSSGKMNIGPAATAGIQSATLIDYAFLVGPQPEDLASAFDPASLADPSQMTAILHPQLLYLDRASVSRDIDIGILPYLCFPSGIDVVGEYDFGRAEASSPSPSRSRLTAYRGEDVSASGRSQTFVFMLNDHLSSHFAICLVVPRSFRDNHLGIVVTTNYCICVVTEYPYFSFLIHILQRFEAAGGFAIETPIDEQVEGLLLRPDLRFLGQLLTRLKKQTVPGMGQCIDIGVALSDCSLAFSMRRLHGAAGVDRGVEKDNEVCYHAMLWALPPLLCAFPLDQVLLLLGCALTEMSIIVVAPYLKQISACIHALLNLLRPLKWHGSVIVSCPEAFIADFFENPVFFMIGVQRLPQQFVQSKGVVVLDVSKRTVLLHEDDVVDGNTLTMPQSNRLSRLLKPDYESIKAIATATSIETKGGWEDLPDGDCMPPELDLTSEAGQGLRGAVSSFSSTVNRHIMTVINTSIQQDKEARQNVNRKRRPRGKTSSEAAFPEFVQNLSVDIGIPVKGPSFTLKEVGVHGSAFINRFLCTQMYSMYCQLALTQAAESRADSNSSLSPRTLSGRSEFRLQELAENTRDPWTTIFGMIICGSTPVDLSIIERVKREYRGSILPALPSNNPGKNGISAYLCRGNCMGKANTAECNFLCVQLWTEKVKALRHQLYLHDIVRSYNPHEIVLNDVILPDGKIVRVRPRLDPFKHKSETNSQYHRRKSEVLMVERSRMTSEQRSRRLMKRYADAVIRSIKRKKIANQRRKLLLESVLNNAERMDSAATTIQCYFRRYLVRRNIIPMIRELMGLRRERYLRKLLQIMQKSQIMPILSAKNKLEPSPKRPVSPKSNSMNNVYDAKGKVQVKGEAPIVSQSSETFLPLTSKTLTHNKRNSFGSIVHSKNEDDNSSLDSGGSFSTARTRLGSMMATLVKGVLGGNPRQRGNSLSSVPIDEEREGDSGDGTPRMPSKDLAAMINSPKLLWRKVKEPNKVEGPGQSILPMESKSEKVLGAGTKAVELSKAWSDDIDIHAGLRRSSDALSAPSPLRSLDPSIFKSLNAQQRQILVDMWKLLRVGVNIRKFNASGRANQRYLFCDVDMKKLYWRITDKSRDNSGVHNDISEDEADLPIERGGRPVPKAPRRTSISFVKTDFERELLFDEIIEVNLFYSHASYS